MIGRKTVEKNDECSKILFRTISKTVTLENGTVVPGVDVETHCKITGYVAEALLKTLSNANKISLLAKHSDFIAAIHDVGKDSPCFQRMIYKNINGFDIDKYSELKLFNPENAKRKNKAFHGTVTEAVVKDNDKNKYLHLIEGMHHGFRPCSPESSNSEIYGGSAWALLRQKLLKNLEKIFLNGKEDWPVLNTWEQSCVEGGFITVCDWIASGGNFASITLDDLKTDKELRTMAQDAVEKAGFNSFNIVKSLSFADIFGFNPRDVQTDFFDFVNGPGVYVLEAPMGIGKTEAALFVAYKMLEKGLASGIYFGLPTQLTSNKIYERVESFVEKICGKKKEDVDLKLLHSSAWLEEKSFGEDGDVGKSWFNSSKRGILAPFAVGTVDQALMAVMNVKHGMVRAFGLAGKVVILDEVHSYDSYTGTILNELVDALRKDNCTVIILSATLTSFQKANILHVENLENVQFKKDYPLITSLPKDEKMFFEKSEAISEKHKVSVSVTEGFEKTLETVLEKADNGEQVLWIENTVSEAQSVYKIIASQFGGMNIECGLIHSRFIRTARNNNESYWVSLYGKDAGLERKKCGRILVGTQVLEQSIDIDADFLVTRICPTDMLLQRMGRLYRHRTNDVLRPKSAICSVVILAPKYEDAVKKENCFGLSSYVYSEYVLCRTLEIWQNKKEVELPSDIRGILESTYEDRLENGRLASLKTATLNKKTILQSAALIGLSTAVNTMPESAAQTRYSDIENISILLMKSFIQTEECYDIIFYNDDKISIPKKCYSYSQKKMISKKIMENSVVVSEKNAPPVDREIQLFSPYVYIGNSEDNESPFRAAVVGDDEILRSLMNVRIVNDGKEFLYNSKLGYQVNKKEEVL